MKMKPIEELSKSGQYQRKFRETHPTYYRDWRRNHPENVKQTNFKYWSKKFAELTAEENNLKGD